MKLTSTVQIGHLSSFINDLISSSLFTPALPIRMNDLCKAGNEMSDQYVTYTGMSHTIL